MESKLSRKTPTISSPIPLPLLLLFLILTQLLLATLAAQPSHLTCHDLLTLTDLFRGEFDNSCQHEVDTALQSKGKDFHFLVQRFHVPIRVPALHRRGGLCTESQQFYLEQYFNESPSPQFQRIFNFVLKDGHITMETHQNRGNQSVAEAWEQWREDIGQFERLTSLDLDFDPGCDVEWSKTGKGWFTAKSKERACVFDYRNTEVYLRSTVHLTESSMIQDEHFHSVKNSTIVAGANVPYVYRRKTDTFIPGHAISSGNRARCQQLRCWMCSFGKIKRQRGKDRRLKRWLYIRYRCYRYY